MLPFCFSIHISACDRPQSVASRWVVEVHADGNGLRALDGCGRMPALRCLHVNDNAILTASVRVLLLEEIGHVCVCVCVRECGCDSSHSSIPLHSS